MSKILYMSCHSILEYEEVLLLHELGHEVFPAGAYVDPAVPHDDKRPSIPGMTVDPDLLAQYGRLAPEGVDSRDCLTKEFVDNFDHVIVMHLPRWISGNWSAIKHKNVIWRTIGQSVSSIEKHLSGFRRHGMQIVRYSPKEASIPGYIGSDALVRFYKDPNDYKDWTGEKQRIITFAQQMKNRAAACSYDFFESVTRPFERHLFGPGNEGEDWTSGAVPFSRLKEELRTNRIYFYTGTHPASYTLNFMEAWMTGIPVIALGPEHGNAKYFPGHDLYEVPELVNNGVDGFVSDNVQEIHTYIETMFHDHEFAKKIGDAGRESAIKYFGKEKVKEAWKSYLGD